MCIFHANILSAIFQAAVRRLDGYSSQARV
jgi:hypothetical protein